MPNPDPSAARAAKLNRDGDQPVATADAGRKPHPRRSAVPAVPVVTCSVNAAVAASGLGRTTLYRAMNDGELKFKLVRGRRVIDYASLKAMLAPDQT
jgi:hypothetical protein